MKRKNVTRNALFTSVISLLLCVSMLVGTTFAWFTDEVVTGMNTIAAGNLDVELLANGTEVDSSTKLFNLVDAQGNDTWWEPGMVVYEKLQVANEGTLALKYQLTLNFGHENDLNGHKLSEVLKVAVLEENKVANWNDRAAVLTAAKAAVAADQGVGALSNFYEVGELEAGVTGDPMYVVIFWAPNDNATDNLYNANNDQSTSDGQPLHIEFGVNLQATQKMSESDSFGNDYDESAAILPKATVNNTGAQTVDVYVGQGYTGDTISLDTSFQFLPNETEDEGAASDYADWHADYVISADTYVPANSIALAGYYEAWCGNNGWVALVGGDVQAGDEVRLVAGALGRTVSYEEICEYGNDGIGFLCGATDLTGANVGTTITVELRMYETDETLGALSSVDSETGHYEVIGTITYTFGYKPYTVNNSAELAAAIQEGREDLWLNDGNYVMPNGGAISLSGKTLTINGTKGAVIDVAHIDARDQFVTGANLTFNGVTLNFGTANYMGFANTSSLTYKNCDINGYQYLYGPSISFEGCTFTSTGYSVCTYGGENVTFTGCTFNTEGKCILIYKDDSMSVTPVVEVEGCTFNASQEGFASAITNQSCAAIEMHNYATGVTLTTSGNTVDSEFSGEWRIKQYDNGGTITVNGTVYTQTAVDGRLMTVTNKEASFI